MISEPESAVNTRRPVPSIAKTAIYALIGIAFLALLAAAIGGSIREHRANGKEFQADLAAIKRDVVRRHPGMVRSLVMTSPDASRFRLTMTAKWFDGPAVEQFRLVTEVRRAIRKACHRREIREDSLVIEIRGPLGSGTESRPDKTEIETWVNHGEDASDLTTWKTLP